MRILSPMRDDLMVQQQIANSWQHMVGVICLNQTNRKIVKAILPDFFMFWPTAQDYLSSFPEEIIDLIRPMGFYNRRERTLRKMSEDWLTWDGNDATMLYGIGEYGSESYRIFFKNERFEPHDKELRKYLGY